MVERAPVAPKISLVLADVDGTLVTTEKVLTEAAKAAARDDLPHAGIAFAITSGRPPRGMAMLIAPLALRTPIAGFNGGVFVNPDLSVIESHTLDLATAKEALTLILDQGLDAWVYTAEAWLIRDKAAPHVAREAWTVKFNPEVVTGVHGGAFGTCGKNRRRFRRSRSRRGLREGSTENTRREGKCGAIAALLSRCDPPAS